MAEAERNPGAAVQGYAAQAPLHPGFCNGPREVNPFLLDPLAGHLLLYGIGAKAVT